MRLLYRNNHRLVVFTAFINWTTVISAATFIAQLL